ASTGGGGWPMTVFLTPDLKPFFGGTYFPPEDRDGMRGFPTVLTKIHEAWEKDHDKLAEMAEGFTKALRTEVAGEVKAAGPMTMPLLAKAAAEYKLQFDEERGGFGTAPKFPRPAVFHFLLRYHMRTGDADAKRMTLSTLDAMARGGMHDQLGGGFHRYSTDGRWFLPHFEKMLYDQGPLAGAYLDAYQLTHEEVYASVARDILDYVMRDMTGSEGQFYSAEDADSAIDPAKPDEKAEGAFYVWSKEEIDALLGKDAEIFEFACGVMADGNVKVDPRGEFKGKNVLYTAHSVQETAKQCNRTEAEVMEALERAKNVLLKARSSRPHPHLDDKTITAWNGLVISAFARAGPILHEAKYTQAAVRAAEFVRTRLYDQKAKFLKRRFRDGQANVDGFSDDYAFYIQGLLDLYEATLDVKWLKLALELQQVQDSLFWDEAGGYFASSATDQTLLLRIKESSDNAEPASSSVAALNLLRLAQMTDDKALRDKADKTLAHFAARLADHPSAMPQMLSAAMFGMSHPKQIIIASKGDTPDRQAMLEEIYREYLPNKIILGADGAEAQRFLGERVTVLNDVSAIDGKATAYVCENYVCKLPTTELKDLRKMLSPPK
ncbi:MAG TPA: thioredoxin domain-containing protein, partial [Tepidisphaeraceae bacterium]|nr:thioredoxin domain-containing protein [Tepidisphaeraceae bacterium]